MYWVQATEGGVEEEAPTAGVYRALGRWLAATAQVEQARGLLGVYAGVGGGFAGRDDAR